jgi:CBS-domain-containing membrane protein
MSRSVVTTTPQTEFHRAYDLMRARGIHHLPVVEGDQVVGIVADRDLLLAAANFGSAEVPIAEIMSTPAVCVSDSVQLKQAARLLVENHIGSLPVLNARKALVGIITETDIFKTIAGMLPARLSIDVAPKKTAKKAAAKKVAKKAVTKKVAKKVAKKAPTAAAGAKKSPRAGSGAKAAPASKRAKASPTRTTPRRSASR